MCTQTISVRTIYRAMPYQRLVALPQRGAATLGGARGSRDRWPRVVLASGQFHWVSRSSTAQRLARSPEPVERSTSRAPSDAVEPSCGILEPNGHVGANNFWTSSRCWGASRKNINFQRSVSFSYPLRFLNGGCAWHDHRYHRYQCPMSIFF